MGISFYVCNGHHFKKMSSKGYPQTLRLQVRTGHGTSYSTIDIQTVF